MILSRLSNLPCDVVQKIGRVASFAWLLRPLGKPLVLISSCIWSIFSAPLRADDSAVGVRAVILPAQSEIAVGGDCNAATVWVKDQLRIYSSPYPLGDFPGGAAWYSYGASVQNLQGSRGVNPDRSLLA